MQSNILTPLISRLLKYCEDSDRRTIEFFHRNELDQWAKDMGALEMLLAIHRDPLILRMSALHVMTLRELHANEAFEPHALIRGDRELELCHRQDCDAMAEVWRWAEATQAKELNGINTL